MLKAGQHHERRWGLGKIRARIQVTEISLWRCKICKTTLCKPFGVAVVTEEDQFLVLAPEPIDCACESESQIVPISFDTRDEAVVEVQGIHREVELVGNLDWLPVFKLEH